MYDSPVRAGSGFFITFEGLDGCGKSTQLEKLAAALREEGRPIVVTREPGGTAIGDRIRAILLDSATKRLSPQAELALMFASRAQHVEEVILPALAHGTIVLCDRFTDSSEAYQGGGRKLGSEAVLALHEVLCRGLNPDLTILMDSDPADSVARARRRNAVAASGSDEGRFERENRDFFESVRQAYLRIARRDAHRVVIVNAREPIDTVHREILSAVRKKLGALAGV